MYNVSMDMCVYTLGYGIPFPHDHKIDVGDRHLNPWVSDEDLSLTIKSATR